MSLILLSGAGAAVLLAFLFLLLFRILMANRRAAVSSDLENIFAPSRYRPMERLLDPLDCEFLATHPSYSRSMGRKFRANRIALFRGYVGCLNKDFFRVSHALKTLMIHASVDRSALAGLLLKQRLTFTYAMAALEVKLTLHSFGWSAPAIDVQELTAALDAMRAQLRALTAIAQPSAA